MKKFKIALCALLVLCSGLFFAACGEEKTKTFDASKISIADETAVYDGNSHIFTVNYNGVKNLNVTYSKTKNGSFVSKNNLGLVDADEYDVYYKLSAKGYKSYISANPVTFTISQKPYEFEFGNGGVFQFNVNNTFNVDEVVSYTHNVVGNDDVEPQFKIFKQGEPNTLFPTDPAEIAALSGQTYKIALTGIAGTDAANYSYVSDDEQVATLNLTDNIMVKNGPTETYYHSLAEAISNATEENDIVQLLSDVEIDEEIEINSNVKIYGFGHKITLSNNFEPGEGEGKDGRYIFAANNATLTLKNVVIDGAQKVTCVLIDGGKIEIKDGAKIINGKRTVEGKTSPREVDKLVGGLYLTGQSELVMEDGEITGNKNDVDGEYERDARKYASDLWIGSEAKATISGGTIGNMFINSNTFQAGDSLTTIGGTAHIENAFVELDSNKQAKLILEADNLIDNIFVKTGTSEGSDKVKTYSNEQVVAGKYKGGAGLVSIKSGDVEYDSLQDAVNAVANEGVITIFHSIEINSQVNIPSNKEFKITSNDGAQWEISATDNFEGTAIISTEKNATNVKLTLENIVIDGNLKTSCLYLKNTELTIKGGANICNGKLMVEDAANLDAKFLQNGGVYMTGKSIFNMEGGIIKNNHNADKDGVEFGSKTEDSVHAFAKDLWLGSEVVATVTGGEIGNVWVNANRFTTDESLLTVKGSAEIEEVYLNYGYDNGVAYAAKMLYGYDGEEFIAGCTAKINHINIANYFISGEERTITTLNGTDAYNAYRAGLVATLARPEGEGFEALPETIFVDYDSFKSFLESGLGSSDVAYEINLIVDIQLSSTYAIKQNITINGNNHTISAIKADGDKFGATNEGTYSGKENRSLFIIPNDVELENLEVKFNNITLDGKGLARGLSLFKGNISLENVTIKNGKADDKFWSGGVFLTSNAQLSIKNSTITGNVQYDEDSESDLIAADQYINFAADLWVGANATADVETDTETNVESLVVENSTIGNVWVNSNEYAAENPGAFTIKSGKIDNVWVEFDKGYGAVLNVLGGEIGKLYISQGYTENNYNNPVVINNAGAGIYVGGANAYATKNDAVVYDVFENIVADSSIENINLVADVEVKKVIKIENEKNLTIDGTNESDNFTIKASSEFAAEENLNGTSLATIFYVNQATLTIKNANLNGNSVARAISSFDANINLEDVEVTGGKDVDGRLSGGVFLSDETIATLTNCELNNNSVSDESGIEPENKLFYSADLWIGSEVKATINGGSYGSIFVNANEFSNSSEEDPNLTINDGATIENMWVEYDQNSAHVQLNEGSISFLHFSDVGSDDQQKEVTDVVVNAGEEGKTIIGGFGII